MRIIQEDSVTCILASYSESSDKSIDRSVNTLYGLWKIYVQGFSDAIISLTSEMTVSQDFSIASLIDIF